MTQRLPTSDGALSGDALLDEIAKRAFRYFWETADVQTGLVKDRANNRDGDDYTVASVAATGYGLASLPIGVERGWVTRAEATQRAEKMLRFLLENAPHRHGWLFHFLDRQTGERVWRSEVSSIDTALLVAGALLCGQYFPDTEAEKSANRLYDRLDWDWMRTNNSAKPDKRLLSHGWTPERGFLRGNWDIYNEGMLLYLLGLGATPQNGNPLPTDSWTAWERIPVRHKDRETLTGGPLFLHQMCHGFFDLRGCRDSLDFDYWSVSAAAVEINRTYCIDRGARWGYGPNVWGLNACDGPSGYKSYGGPGIVGKKDDGTVSPTGAIASIIFTPDAARAAAQTLYDDHGDRLWGRFGFANAFNLKQNWFGEDVIGIDLGMALLALENHRSGLPWRLMMSHPAATRALSTSALCPP